MKKKREREEENCVFKNVNGILESSFPCLLTGSLLIKYHVVTLAMPSGAFEPWICEESFSRLCARAVFHNFLSSNNIGTSGQEARLLSHHHIHSLADCPDINFVGLGVYVENLCVYKRGEERGELAQLSIFNFFFFLPFFFPWKISPLFLITLLKSHPHWRVVLF